jgi:hypothetical protein
MFKGLDLRSKSNPLNIYRANCLFKSVGRMNETASFILFALIATLIVLVFIFWNHKFREIPLSAISRQGNFASASLRADPLLKFRLIAATKPPGLWYILLKTIGPVPKA